MCPIAGLETLNCKLELEMKFQGVSSIACQALSGDPSDPHFIFQSQELTFNCSD